MAKKDDKKKATTTEAPRPDSGGSVVAEDEEFTLWLNKLWARNEFPQRIEVWQAFGRNGQDRGEMIHHEDFRHGEKLNIEQVTKLSNEIMAACQHDCDSRRPARESSYNLAVIDPNRKSSPLTRRIGPIQPKRSYALAKVGGSGEDDEDDEELNAKSLSHRYTKESFDQIRWDKQRNDRIAGEMLFLQHQIITNQQSTIDNLMNRVVTAFEKMQESEDRKVQRDILLEREKFKLGLWKDGMRTARNLLPGLFGGTESGAPQQQQDASGNAIEVSKTPYGPSPERTLVDNFLNDCEEAKIDIALFGDFEERDGKLVQVKEGIFAIEQFHILLGVRAGRLPVDALDVLMPNSGHKHAITEAQLNQAIQSGVTQGIGMALMELVGLRQRAKEAQESKSTSNENQPQ